MSSADQSRTRWRAPLAVAVPLLLVLTGGALSGCGPEPAARADAVSGSTPSGTAGGSAPTTSPPGPTITTNARNGLPTTSPLTISVPGGTLDSVVVTSPYGTLTGRFNAARTQWTSSVERAPDVTFRITASATGASGGTGALARTFSSGHAKRILTADVEPWGDARVGVGQPIVVKLSSPVTKSQRAQVEKALVVNADKPIGPASWYWWSSTQVHYRPKDFWPAHTKVQVAVNLAGVRGGPGLWGITNRTVSFSIGRAFVMRISNASHMMTVSIDGKVVRRVPVSMGRSGYATRSGIKTIMSHEKSVRMTSESYGGADFYDEIVHYAQRITWSGEFIHSAPWSVGAQGRANVSHGCVNVSPANAVWLFGQTQIGDPVITTGTDRRMEPGNGTGGDWNISWANWLAGSALH